MTWRFVDSHNVLTGRANFVAGARVYVKEPSDRLPLEILVAQQDNLRNYDVQLGSLIQIGDAIWRVADIAFPGHVVPGPTIKEERVALRLELYSPAL